MKWLAAFLALWSCTALAHEHWINKGGYANPKRAGEHCCGPSDCMKVDAAVTRVTGGWRVRQVGVVHNGSGQPLIHPIDEVVPDAEATPSEDGHFWRCQRPDGERRCFFVPTPAMM
jgi:hypothetical protein